MNKKHLIIISVFLSVLLLLGTFQMLRIKNSYAANILNSQEKEGGELSEISVTGSASISVKSDLAVLTLGYQNEAKDALSAQQKNDSVMDSVIKAIKNAGVDEKNIKTISYSLQPIYIYNEKERRNELIGFSAMHLIKIELEDIKMAGKILKIATENGANQIQGVSFKVKPETLEVIKKEAIKLAINDAKEKAKIALEPLSKSIFGVKSVALMDEYYPIFDKASFVGGESSSPVEGGTSTIRVSVSVIFTF